LYSELFSIAFGVFSINHLYEVPERDLLESSAFSEEKLQEKRKRLKIQRGIIFFINK